MNSVPLLANFGSNTRAFTYGLGNKNYERRVFNANQIINDDVAIRVMGVSTEPGTTTPLNMVN